MTPNTYTDPQFLTALRECPSVPVRALAIRLDSLAVFLRDYAIEPQIAADQLNEIGIALLDLAAAKKRRTAA
jgi:hypothetical protein